MSSDGDEERRERELVDPVLLGSEAAGGRVHAGRRDGALVVGHHGAIPVRLRPVARERRRSHLK